MIICDNCNVCVTKNSFCSDKCRIQYHRSNASVTKAVQAQRKINKIIVDKIDERYASVTAISNLQEVVTINTPPRKSKKVDKDGYCPHFIKADGYCRECEE